ncbi:MAG TPA: phosphoribosylamine--glycine ligase [Acidimicrobiales bacterium]|nr:phosphoribosylamine--glycine ligase [Acidimicrobiales bacterium]
MRVAVVGGGGREQALRHVLSRTAEVVEDDDADLYVIGPEAPLVEGLADRLRADGKLVFGPGADGARLEGSKAWMKEVLAAAGVPTARHGVFKEVDPAVEFLKSLPGLYVVKTDGLAAGKGVLVTESLADAADDVRAKLSGSAFGAAGRTVVIEEGLSGGELSVLAVCDGKQGVVLPTARDFKRAGDGDSGPNTGGMGAYSPVAEAEGHSFDEIIDRTLVELRRRGIDYRGVLYAGLMLTPDGVKVLEYNVRFGDPEAQVVLPRFDGDLARLLAEAAAGDLRSQPASADDACVCVVLAAAGYPMAPRSGDVIAGVEEARQVGGVLIFEAGVGRDDTGRLVAAGGRVLDVCALGPTVAEARRRAYEAVGLISFDGMHFRSDIAA